MGKLAKVSWFEESNICSKCGAKKSTKKSCCSDDSIMVKTVDHTAGDTFHLPVEFISDLPSKLWAPIHDIYFPVLVQNRLPWVHGPPGGTCLTPVYLLNCNFLI